VRREIGEEQAAEVHCDEGSDLIFSQCWLPCTPILAAMPNRRQQSRLDVILDIYSDLDK